MSTSPSHEIRKRLAVRDRFSLVEVRQWMMDGGDLDRWAAVYDVLGPGWQLIHPAPDMDETCAFISRYLLCCIHENVQDAYGHVPTGYEAAHDLAACLKHWATKLPETQSVLSDAATKITQAYLEADSEERDRLLTGMLEHAFESERVLPYFEQWKTNPVLGDAWTQAMEWAGVHRDPAAG